MVTCLDWSLNFLQGPLVQRSIELWISSFLQGSLVQRLIVIYFLNKFNLFRGRSASNSTMGRESTHSSFRSALIIVCTYMCEGGATVPCAHNSPIVRHHPEQRLPVLFILFRFSMANAKLNRRLEKFSQLVYSTVNL